MSRFAVFFLVVITLGLAILLALLGAATIQSNLLGWFLLISGSVYFFGIIIVYWIRRRQFWRPQSNGETIKEESDDRSFWLITVGMVAAFFLPPIEYLFASVILPRVEWMQVTGLTLIVLGSALFIWARRTLGKFYSGHVSVVEGQPLVQSGPYHFIRHPAYAGYFLMSLGLALGYSSLLGLAAVFLLLLPVMIYRLRLEDKLLAEHFGEEFKKYAAVTKCLIPGIW
jgi:protein-S-isoprenylcysteine O-methyltransferase Ste14